MASLLVSATELAAHTADPAWCIFDCRHDLVNADYGRQAYDKGHIPGARYLNLDTDLSGTKTGRNGRHPLPDPEVFAARMRAVGVGAGSQVVAYDNEGGAFAARLWWMMRWLGHEHVAVLDGGLAAWRRLKLELSVDVPAVAAGDFQARPQAGMILGKADVLASLGEPQSLLLDARAPERYAGTKETIDPVGGHIPGAVNRFFFDNLDDVGVYFKSADELRGDFAALLGGRRPQDVIQQCGSGVTACHNVLAMELAGLAGSRLYPGSWSEWCADPELPKALPES
jgi:thiosulfate/3-mercaptopyruvate sulfurtransferase